MLADNLWWRDVIRDLVDNNPTPVYTGTIDYTRVRRVRRRREARSGDEVRRYVTCDWARSDD